MHEVLQKSVPDYVGTISSLNLNWNYEYPINHLIGFRNAASYLKKSKKLSATVSGKDGVCTVRVKACF